uniref:Ovule protein n=1 Tax=Rhabditophanes sp. KR3021 TaxID=114890 RepID=A0AC35TSC1_9BILA
MRYLGNHQVSCNSSWLSAANRTNSRLQGRSNDKNFDYILTKKLTPQKDLAPVKKQGTLKKSFTSIEFVNDSDHESTRSPIPKPASV